MVVCKENHSRILVNWEGRIKITSVLTAEENCSL